MTNDVHKCVNSEFESEFDRLPDGYLNGCWVDRSVGRFVDRPIRTLRM